jgi:hypothetical protein
MHARLIGFGHRRFSFRRLADKRAIMANTRLAELPK